MLKRNTQKMEIDYDANADVLYINFGKPQKGAIAENGDFLAGIIIMENPLTKKVTGITLDAFTQRVKKGYLDSIVKKTHPYISKTMLLKIYNEIEGASSQTK
jgi:uncharacterized protein YuzE